MDTAPICDTVDVRFTLAEVAGETGGTVLGDPSIVVHGASTDSRDLAPDALFVPVVAARDGHDFIAAAMGSRAAAHLTSRGESGYPAVMVEDTVIALGVLGRLARSRISRAVIAVTGSVGKTTTKDLLAAVLETTYVSHASTKSFNNELGVPLTLASAADGTEVAVVEMGARGAGHISELCDIALPDVGIVTTVGEAHTELFGDVAAVARAKGELIESLPVTGTAVLNADDDLVASMRSRTVASVVTFGLKSGEVRAEQVDLDDRLRPEFTLRSPWGSVRVHLAASGLHLVSNALGAAAAALVVGVDIEAVGDGLAQAQVSPWRMDLGQAPSGALVLNDAYNANPISMNAALDSLDATRAPRRLAILGVMAELGAIHHAAHEAIGQRTSDDGVEVISVGVGQYGGEVVGSAEDAIDLLAESVPLGEDAAVLVKGSRVAGLEVVAAWLLANG